MQFYDVLQINLKKLGLKSVHSYEDLIDLKYNRFVQEIEFYGVFLEKKMIAGSMVFLFDGRISICLQMNSIRSFFRWISLFTI